ncbi:hypothetical protein GQ53DRAFT_743069 [Thozetella sp. PMI_491]|nr:hypothetical protein GQ53DRAFT_743069 [Thozetella sp. PMI_491]
MIFYSHTVGSPRVYSDLLRSWELLTWMVPVTTAIQPSLDLLRYWLAPSFSHPGIMHGMLCLAAIQLGVEWPEEPRHFERFMYHRIQAIAAVHQDLAGPQQALSDGNIATVFCLLSAEENLHAHAIAAHAGAWQHLQPDSAQRAAHLAGLKQMLALRGGVISLGNTRAVQSFVIRWARTARNCRLVCLIPQAMPSPTAAEDAANQAGAILTDSYVWPDDLLKQVHSHPSYTVSSLYGSRMASICKEAGMSRILVSVIFAVDCQIKSAGTWLSSRQNHTWDAIDIQNLFATSIGNLACWILEHEGTLTPAENVTALCAFVVVCWTSGGSTSFHGLPGVLPRLRRYLRVQGVKQALQAAGLHAWVGILIYIMSTNVPEDEDYFFRAYLQLLAQGQPLIQTLGDLKTSLSTCIWISQSLDQYAETVWFHTSDTIHDLQATSIEDAELITTAARPLTPPFYIKPALPLAMPYTMAALNSMSGDDGPIWKSFLED